MGLNIFLALNRERAATVEEAQHSERYICERPTDFSDVELGIGHTKCYVVIHIQFKSSTYKVDSRLKTTASVGVYYNNLCLRIPDILNGEHIACV